MSSREWASGVSRRCSGCGCGCSSGGDDDDNDDDNGEDGASSPFSRVLLLENGSLHDAFEEDAVADDGTTMAWVRRKKKMISCLQSFMVNSLAVLFRVLLLLMTMVLLLLGAIEIYTMIRCVDRRWIE